MGVVYRALDRERGVQVALKTLRGATPDSVLRFKTEFRSLRDVRHPNLAALGELFESNGQWFFTMELIRGAPLLAWVRSEAADKPSTDSLRSPISDELPTIVTPMSEQTAATSLGESEKEARPPRADEAKLRQALAGLASGLAALHAAGKIHRDVKPSNVIVEDSGRAVLLDFGVVAERADTGLDEQQIIGTVSYMAPEQARGEVVGPPTDWYALGVVLFQALTGRLPLAADSRALLELKQHTPSPDVSRFVDVPDDLAKLCMKLLERDASVRPSEAQIFEWLGVPRTVVVETAWAPHATDGTLFVGRRVELGLLEAALAASHHGAVTVVVEGESGVGKTALIEHFCVVTRATHKKAMVLRGRCHQRERVAFNAFDGIVHELARWLIARPDPKVAALVPARVNELVAVFPDLRAVPIFAAAATPPLDRAASGAQAVLQTPIDLRDRAFSALRELLVTMAQRGPIVLVVDDLQWADDDSLAALSVLLADRVAPPILVLATLRSGAVAPALGGDTRTISLTGLAPIDAEKLLLHLGVQFDSQLIEETNGHPLFLAELVRHRSRAGTAPRLDDAIWSRASTLDPEARKVLATIAVAGGALPRDLVLESSGLTPMTAEAALDRLARAQLVKLHGPRRTDAVEPARRHDRPQA